MLLPYFSYYMTNPAPFISSTCFVVDNDIVVLNFEKWTSFEWILHMDSIHRIQCDKPPKFGFHLIINGYVDKLNSIFLNLTHQWHYLYSLNLVCFLVRVIEKKTEGGPDKFITG